MLLLFAVIFISFYLKPEESSPKPTNIHSTGPTSVFVNVHNTNNNNNNNSNQQNQHNDPKIHNSIAHVCSYIIPSFIMKKIQNKELSAAKTQENLITLRNFIIKYLILNQYKIIFGSCFTAYGSLWGNLLLSAYYVAQDHGWANWKNNIAFEMLRAIPQQELGKELLYAIQKKYQSPTNLTDFLTPLMLFLKDIEKEKKKLNKFLNTHKLIKAIYLKRIFPTQENLIKKTQERIMRLDYLKDVFLHWITDYKIALNTQSPGS